MKIQAKHLDTDKLLEVIDVLGTSNKSKWAFLWDIEPAFPDFPPKVVLAKLKSLHRRGLIEGCCCGYREGRIGSGGYEASGKRIYRCCSVSW